MELSKVTASVRLEENTIFGGNFQSFFFFGGGHVGHEV